MQCFNICSNPHSLGCYLLIYLISISFEDFDIIVLRSHFADLQRDSNTLVYLSKQSPTIDPPYPSRRPAQFEHLGYFLD